MDGLRERDLQNLLEILGEVHHAEDVPSFRAALLDVVPRVIPNAYTSYNEIGADGTPLVAIVTPMPEQRLLESWGRYGHQSPLVERYLRTRDPRAYRLSDVIGQAEFQQLDLYREVFVPLGVEHQLVITLPAPPTLLIGLALADARDFTDGERRVLDLARPHLIQAHANAVLRERLRDVLAAVEAGLDDGGDAVVVIDARGRVELATRAGRASLRALGAGRAPDAGLPAPLAELLAARKAPTHAILARPDGGEPIVVRRLSRAAGGATVVVFERRGRSASRELLEALGLSPREAEVLQLMMRGQATAAIATDLEVSPRTVSKHAERIYDKLGVHDRVAAVSAAWSALDSGRTALSA